VAACAGLFLFHFFIIWTRAVNIPFFDEWDVFYADRPTALSLEWLNAQQNEHRLATGKTFIWLQIQLNGWNIAVNIILNFIIYGLLLAFFVRFARKVAPQIPAWITLAFIIFLLSPIVWFNHFMAYQMVIHFYLLFFLVAAYFLFSEHQRWLDLSLGSAAAILSIYSFAAGFISCLILLGTFCAFKGLRAYSASGKSERSRELLQLALVVLLVGCTLFIWTIGHASLHTIPLTYPNTLRYWVVFLNYVSFSFGIDKLSSEWGLVCLFIILAPICVEIWRRKGKLSSAHWAIFSVVIAIIVNLAAMTLGRASIALEVSKSGQYAENAILLIPLTALNWAMFLHGRERLKARFLIGLWVFYLVTFSNNWNFNIYRTQAALRAEGAECVKAYYEGRGEPLCPTIYPRTIPATYLEKAKKLNLSFYRSLNVQGDN
jgi:hypothetical protein